MTRRDLFKIAEVYKPSFCFEKIQPFKSEWLEWIRYFPREHIWEQTSINIFRVIGTQHPDYQDLTWSEFLHRGKRMPLNLELFEKNPGYYLDIVHKEPVMHYVQVDDSDYYVGKDGNHRTCIAKFFFFLKGINILHGVEVSIYRIDHRAVELFRALRKKGFLPHVHSKVVAREDSPGWMREKFEILFHLNGREISLDEAERIVESKKGSLFKKIWFFGLRK